MKDSCPTCDGLKDVRSIQCYGCQVKHRPNRKGTGAEYTISTNGYILIMVDNKARYKHRIVMEECLQRKLEKRRTRTSLRW